MSDWKLELPRSLFDLEAMKALLEVQWALGPEEWATFQSMMIDVLTQLDDVEVPLDIDRLIFQNPQLSDRMDEDDEFLRGVTKLGDFLGHFPRLTAQPEQVHLDDDGTS